jgi:hypothetical protein
MNYPNGIKISELTPVGAPNRSDVIVLNVSDRETRKITYNNLVENIKVKVAMRSDWDQTNPNELDFIKNKPSVYVADSYIQNLLTIN